MQTTQVKTTQLGTTSLEITRTGRSIGPAATVRVHEGIAARRSRAACGNLQLVDRLERVAERHDTTSGAVAVAWTLRQPAVDGATVGFRRPEHVDPLIDAADLELSDDDITTIEAEE